MPFFEFKITFIQNNHSRAKSLSKNYPKWKIFHYESIIFPNFQPFLPLPPKPVIDNEQSEEEIVIKSPKRQSTRLESKRVKKNKVMEEEVYIDGDTIFIS